VANDAARIGVAAAQPGRETKKFTHQARSRIAGRGCGRA
jgi:hypothetical protein